MARPRAAAPGRRRWRWLGLAIAVVAVAAAAYLWVMASRVAHGVRVADVGLGGLTRDAARQQLAARFQQYAKAPLALSYGDRRFEIAPEALGVAFNADATVDAAIAYAKDGNALERAVATGRAAVAGHEIRPVFTIDEADTTRVLDFVAKGVDVPVVDAGLRLDGARVAITASRAGYLMDRDAAKALLAEAYTALAAGPIALPGAPAEPSLREPAVLAAKNTTEHVLSEPVVLVYAERRWPISPTEVAALVRFRRTADGSQLEFGFDAAKVAALAQRLAQEIDREPVDARFVWRDGRLATMTLSQDGLRLRQDELAARLETVTRGGHVIELPVELRPPKIGSDAVARLGVKELIEERSTYYGGAYPERDFNVELAASKLNGLVIGPGETFSYLEAIGDVSVKAGFKTGLSIIGNQTVPDIGGGLCQLSTTVFQTAFWAGYPIVERYAHNYWLARYGPPVGLDATIATPAPDFKFKNNTATHILIQTHTASNRVYVAFYGTKPSWKVDVSGPFISRVITPDRTLVRIPSEYLPKGMEITLETPSNGMDVFVTRTVTEGDTKETYTVSSRYRPQGNVKLYGTSDKKATYGIFVQ